METMITSVALLSVISGLFAFLLTIADRTVANYGPQTMIVNGEKEYTVDGGITLLSALLGEKIFIPSACGGKGSCGYCKVKVLSGGGPVLATERTWLTEEEENDHIRLSCQMKVKERISIEIPEEFFNIREYETVVSKVEKLTQEVKLLTFDFAEGDEINFKPGQYVQLKAPAYDGNDEEVYRAYSIASPAEDPKHLKLLIGYTGGIATTYVHFHLKEGDTVSINGPYGDFYYLDDDTDMILVAVGTGFAPILSILQHMRAENIQRKARFYFGAKTPEDLFLLDEMKQFEEELYDFKFMPTLTRTTDAMNWTGDTGRVTASIDKYVEPNGHYTAYLCGSEGMIDSVVTSLNEKGIPIEQICFDKF